MLQSKTIWGPRFSSCKDMIPCQSPSNIISFTQKQGVSSTWKRIALCQKESFWTRSSLLFYFHRVTLHLSKLCNPYHHTSLALPLDVRRHIWTAPGGSALVAEMLLMFSDEHLLRICLIKITGLLQESGSLRIKSGSVKDQKERISWKRGILSFILNYRV